MVGKYLAPACSDLEKNRTSSTRSNKYPQGYSFVLFFLIENLEVGNSRVILVAQQLLKTQVLPVFPICLPWHVRDIYLSQDNYSSSNCHILSCQYPKAGRVSEVGSLCLFYQVEWGLILSQSPHPLFIWEENLSSKQTSHYISLVRTGSHDPLDAREEDKISTWHFQPLSWEAGFANFEKVAVGFKVNSIPCVCRIWQQHSQCQSIEVSTICPRCPSYWNTTCTIPTVWNSDSQLLMAELYSITTSYSWENWVFPDIQYQATSWEQVCLADQMRNDSSCLIIRSNLKELSTIWRFSELIIKIVDYKWVGNLGLIVKNFPPEKQTKLGIFFKEPISPTLDR